MRAGAEDLVDRWKALPQPAGPLLEAERVIDWAGGRVLVALDVDGRRHLLVSLPAEALTGRRIRPLRGLRTQTRTMRIRGEQATWLDLELLDSNGERVFAALCADLLDALAEATTAELTAVSDVVDRWRRFWTTASDGMSPENRLGLFGELWLLLEWLPQLTTASLTAWRGPLGGRHDFVSPTLSVEVKTNGTATGPVTHRIGSLAQLDEAGEGELYLLSLRTTRDPLGPHNLDALIARARGEAARVGPEARDALDERLGAYGWSPADEGRYAERVGVTTQQLFRVTSDFPRLVPSDFVNGLPDGILDVTYLLDTSACGPWLTARGPQEPHPLAQLAS